ncbi:MAG: hypothetical protein ACJ73L_11610, partial [Actinomycetes bacterium]
ALRGRASGLPRRLPAHADESAMFFRLSAFVRVFGSDRAGAAVLEFVGGSKPSSLLSASYR